MNHSRLTDTLVLIVARRVAHVAVAAVTTCEVDARAVHAQLHVDHALVDVAAVEAVALETVVADAVATSFRVDAGRVQVAAAVVVHALVDVWSWCYVITLSMLSKVQF